LSYREHRTHGFYGGVRKAQRIHARRSNRAKRVDEALRAPIAKSPEQWLAQPNRFDFPDVDTPKKTETKQEPKQQDKLFEPRTLSHSEIQQRLAYHRLYGNIH
jgi:hypothetical protein